MPTNPITIIIDPATINPGSPLPPTYFKKGTKATIIVKLVHNNLVPIFFPLIKFNYICWNYLFRLNENYSRKIYYLDIIYRKGANVSKFKIRKEIRRSFDMMKYSGFTYYQSLSIISLIYSISLALKELENPLEIINEVAKEVYDIGEEDESEE